MLYILKRKWMTYKMGQLNDAFFLWKKKTMELKKKQQFVDITKDTALRTQMEIVDKLRKTLQEKR